MENSRSFHCLTNAFSRFYYIFEKWPGGQLTKTKLTSYERRVVKLIGWKVAWKEGTYGHFAMAMTKFGWKNAWFDEGIEDCS